jgi:glyceraldehyde-3-phosphate dehydrogenase/erythrose-4-phosphate dehydrogenase
MGTLKLGINGFGRIGRLVFRESFIRSQSFGLSIKI